MSNVLPSIFPSFLKGFIYLCLLFAICLVLVVGIKAIFNSFSLYLKAKRTPTPPPETQKSAKQRVRKPSKSIEISDLLFLRLDEGLKIANQSTNIISGIIKIITILLLIQVIPLLWHHFTTQGVQ